MLEKDTTIKKIEYSLLDSEMGKQTNIVKKQYQVLDKAYEFDKKDDLTEKKI